MIANKQFVELLNVYLGPYDNQSMGEDRPDLYQASDQCTVLRRINSAIELATLSDLDHKVRMMQNIEERLSLDTVALMIATGRMDKDIVIGRMVDEVTRAAYHKFVNYLEEVAGHISFTYNSNDNTFNLGNRFLQKKIGDSQSLTIRDWMVYGEVLNCFVTRNKLSHYGGIWKVMDGLQIGNLEEFLGSTIEQQIEFRKGTLRQNR